MHVSDGEGRGGGYYSATACLGFANGECEVLAHDCVIYWEVSPVQDLILQKDDRIWIPDCCLQ